MAEVGSPRLRVVLGATLAILVHGAGLLALRPAGALPAVDAVAEARAARAALLRTAEGDVASGRATLGETLVRLEWLDRVEQDRHGDVAERERALLLYRALPSRRTGPPPATSACIRASRTRSREAGATASRSPRSRSRSRTTRGEGRAPRSGCTRTTSRPR